MTPWTVTGGKPGSLRNTHQKFPHCKHVEGGNRKTELVFSPRLIDKHAVTILARALKPEEERNSRLIPRADLGLSKSCQACQTLFQDQRELCFLKLHNAGWTWHNRKGSGCDFMRLRWRLHCFERGSLAEGVFRNLCLAGKLLGLRQGNRWYRGAQTGWGGQPHNSRGPKWEELEQRCEINGPLVLHLWDLPWTTLSNYVLMSWLHQARLHSEE